MGKGKGLDLDLILRIVELGLLIVAIILFMMDTEAILIFLHSSDYMRASDTMCIAGSLYIILLIILLGLQLIKGEDQDPKFVGTLSAVGAIFLVCSGISVCIFAKDAPENVLISGILGLVGGVALLVDCLKDFSVF